MGLFDQLASAGVAEKPVVTAGASLARQLIADQGLTSVAFDPSGNDPLPEPSTFRGAPVGWSKDLDRIVALPRRRLNDNDPSAARKWTELLRLNRTTPCDCVARWGFCITELRPIQGWALEEFSTNTGFVGPVGVGHGKEGICTLLGMAKPGVRVVMLLLQANLKAQFLQRDLPQWSQHFRVPNLAGGNNPLHRDRPLLHVVTFHELQSPKSSSLVERIRPDLIVVNESQNIASREGPRGKRFLRAFANNPGTMLAALSGTFTKQSLKDYGHIAGLALHEGSPLPLHPPTLDEWASALDAVECPAPLGKLRELCAAGEGAREGFRRRLVETPGVVATTGNALDVTLTLSEFEIEPPATIGALLNDVRETWKRPDGEELVDALQKAAVCRQLASGFFYRWRFPRGETREQVDTWLAARKAWHKELREKLKYGSREGMDSPLLVTKAAIRWHDGYVHIDAETQQRVEVPPLTKKGPLPVWPALHWPEWRRVRDTVQPQTEAVFVDDFFARACAEWAQKNVGIVWYDSDAFGRWVARLGNLPFYGPGADASAKILNEKGTRSIVASYRAHGTGKNLQCFSRNLIAQVPSDGAQIEQLLARTHRPGQKAQEVTAAFPRHTPEVCDAYDTARGRANYIQATMGTPQKLLYAACEFAADLKTVGTLGAQVLDMLEESEGDDSRVWRSGE